MFHNTIWAKNSSGGLRLYNPNTSYHQYCYGNAVFAPLPISNFTDSLNNVVDTYNNAANHVLAASTSLGMLNLYPKAGHLSGTLTPSSLFQANTDWNEDFNADPYNWTFRGAYSGCCNNPGWQLQMDTIPSKNSMTSAVHKAPDVEIQINIYPNPGFGEITLQSSIDPDAVKVVDLFGQTILNVTAPATHAFVFQLTRPGVYLAQIVKGGRLVTKKFVITGEGR